MTNRNDVTAPTDTVNKLKSKRDPNDSQALYGDDLAADANAKASKHHIPEKPKATPPTPLADDKSSANKGRIGKDPTESF